MKYSTTNTVRKLFRIIFGLSHTSYKFGAISFSMSLNQARLIYTIWTVSSFCLPVSQWLKNVSFSNVLNDSFWWYQNNFGI